MKCLLLLQRAREWWSTHEENLELSSSDNYLFKEFFLSKLKAMEKTISEINVVYKCPMSQTCHTYTNNAKNEKPLNETDF